MLRTVISRSWRNRPRVRTGREGTQPDRRPSPSDVEAKSKTRSAPANYLSRDTHAAKRHELRKSG